MSLVSSTSLSPPLAARAPLVEATVRWLGRNNPALIQPYLEFEDFDDDLVHHWHIVSEVFRQCGAPPPDIPIDGTIRMLNIACGYGEDTISLAALFNQFACGFLPRPVDYIGIDLRENALVRARRRAHSTAAFFKRGNGELGEHSLPFRFRFSATDATKLDQLPPFAERFDLVVSRHQNAYQGLDIWANIFAQAVDRLKPDGLLLVTSYYDKEHHIALDTIRACGAKLLISLRNPNSRQMTYEGQTLDRHVALFAGPNASEAICDSLERTSILLP